ncbi:MAG: hypothetical protein HKN43_04160, partial [Rhodothermales bacterium]|nr:hypothetical protein [Rhodothermales bacterium]
MIEPPTSRTHPLFRKSILIPVGLLLASVLTFVAGQLVARQHAAEIDTRITTEIVRAFDDVEERFDSMQSELLELAQSIGSSPEIREGLRVSSGPQQAPSEQVVSYFSSLDTPELVSVELYSP